MPIERAVIIGGGVVGLHLARRLAELGVDATLYEAKRDVSEGADRASGILSIKGLGRTGLDYKGSIIGELSGAYLVAGDEKLRIASKKPVAYVLDRRKLALGCEKAARRAGARIRVGRRVGKEELVEIASDRSTALIGADGAVSGVAGAFGFPSIKEYVLTYKAVFPAKRIKETKMVGLYFSKKFAKGLFGWHVPYSSNRVELGLGIDHRAKIPSSEAFADFMRARISASVVEVKGAALSSHASIIPLCARPITAKGNVALVGDAAGQVKASTGGGIIYGCLCAQILAKTIREGGPLSEYERRWKKEYGRDLGIHRLARSYYTGANLQLTFRALRILGMDSFLGRYGDMDSPSLVLKRFILRGLAD